MLISIITHKEKPNRAIISNKEFAQSIITHKNNLDYSEDWDTVELNITTSNDVLILIKELSRLQS